MSGLYGCDAIAKLIADTADIGYECVEIEEGTLGYGYLVLIAPECPQEGYYYKNFIIQEVYLNEWSSAHKVRTCRKLSKAILAEIENVEETWRDERI